MSKAKRSKNLFRSNIKNAKQFDYLYQWDYYRQIKEKGNTFGKSAFISIVQKDNKFYIDKPYYIYSGDKPHRYRLLNKKISFFIKIYHFNYKLREFLKQIKIGCFKFYKLLLNQLNKIRKKIFKTKEEKEFDKMMNNGILIHEENCPDEWKSYIRECKWCGTKFKPEEKDQYFCCEDCAESYNM